METLVSDEDVTSVLHSFGYSFILSAGAKLFLGTSLGATGIFFVWSLMAQFESLQPLSTRLSNRHPITSGLKAIAGNTVGGIINKAMVVSECLPGRFLLRAIHQRELLPAEDKETLKEAFLCPRRTL